MIAGTIGAAGGITSLVAYPALLIAGLSPLAANVTNIVALTACWPGSALGSRRELAGWGAWLKRYSPVAAIGGCAGAGLLLLTSSGAFTAFVPFMVLAGAAALAIEPRFARRLAARDRASGQRPGLIAAAPMVIWLLGLSLYNGYFGAGAGVMILTLMLLGADRRLPIANALKNMLVGAAQLPSAVLLGVFGPVHWLAALPLAIGMLFGSRLGPTVARTVDPRLLRAGIVGLGVLLAGLLFGGFGG